MQQAPHKRIAHHHLASYAAQADGLSFEVTHSLVAGAIDFIVFVRQNPYMGGRRAVAEVLEVTGFDGERVTSSNLFVPSASDESASTLTSRSSSSRARRAGRIPTAT